MELVADGRRFKVAKSNSNNLLLAEPAQISPGPTELTVIIDDQTAKFRFFIAAQVDGRRVELRVEEALAGATVANGDAN
jgi:hypothetical protein